jgi:hypothetical protein
MLRIFPLWMALLTPALGQLREVTIELRPTDCVTCMESLPERMKRVRGVAGAEMQEAPARVLVRLEADNRVRLTRLLDVVLQDGTGIARVALRAAGEVFDEGGWRFRVLAGDRALRWRGAAPAKAGRAVVSGQIAAPFEAIEVESVEVQP